MIHSETSAKNLALHHCQVQKVYESGLLDVKSLEGPEFERINYLAGDRYAVGDYCMLVSDGAQKIILGKVRATEDGTIHELEDDFFDRNDSEMLYVEDDFGNRALVVASMGAGIWFDTGDFCSKHFNPATNHISEFCERLDVYMPHFRKSLWNDDSRAGLRWRLKTRPDEDMLAGELQGDVSAGESRGIEVNVNIEEQDEAIQISLEDGGQERLRITYRRDKTFKIACDDIVTDGKRVGVTAENSFEVETKLFEVASDDIRMGTSNLDDVALHEAVKQEIQKNRNRISSLEQSYKQHQHVAPSGPTSPPAPTPPAPPDEFAPNSFGLIDLGEALGEVPDMNASNLKAKK